MILFWGAGRNSRESRAKNRKLRQALSCAFDFHQLNRFMNNRLYPINGLIPSPLKEVYLEPLRMISILKKLAAY